MKSSARLSALVVNFNSGAFCTACVASLLHEWKREGRTREDLDLIVVDNASPIDQEEHLLEMERLGATVIRHDENGGYSKGMNLALSHTSGGPQDIVAVLNPDLCFLPGSIGVMMDYLEENKRCGTISPLATIDPLGVLNLPRNVLPTFFDQAHMGASVLSPWLCRAYTKKRVRLNLELWRADGPLQTDMLSGCCLLQRREVIDDIGGLLDERYPLYYEDTDFFNRLTAKGYQLIHHGGAHVLHHWSRSAGVGAAFAGEPQRRYEISRKLYFEEWYNPVSRSAMKGLDNLFAKWPDSKRMRPMHPIQELGAFEGPAEIQLPRHVDNLLIELSVNPIWLVAVGIFAKDTDRWVCPKETWDWFFQAEYFMRAIDLDTGEFLGAYHVVKSVPGRETPMTIAELEGLGDRIFGGAAR